MNNSTEFYEKNKFQVQATVVGFLAAVAAVILGWIPEGKYYLDHSILLCSSSVATAFIASLLQGKNTHKHLLVVFYFHFPIAWLFFLNVHNKKKYRRVVYKLKKYLIFYIYYL